MLDTDFEHMVEYLQVSEDKIKAKGVESVRSRVTNLKEVNFDISLEGLKDSLKASFKEVYGNKELSYEKDYDPSKIEEINGLYDKYSSWEWRYGNTPDFDITFQKRFDWGEVELGLQLKDAVIEQANVYSDAMDVALITQLTSLLEGIPFKRKNILEAIERLRKKESDFSYTEAVEYSQGGVVDDLKEWLAEKEI
jgi:lipoate-protein ligase A